ncbi:MAG TPA: DUF5348 domain-containing protein [Ktedonobacteraceae bacterium]|nr:DUF5348 domain-containing protein [Ktedonobacteraceae bacterium]
MNGSNTIHTLVLSSNRGRYACDDGATGHDLTSGEPIALLLAGRWIPGRVEHSGYPTSGHPEQIGLYSITGLDEPHIGYSFISSTGQEICGLCAGMKITLLR